jgi:hypothetical protein
MTNQAPATASAPITAIRASRLVCATREVLSSRKAPLRRGFRHNNEEK